MPANSSIDRRSTPRSLAEVLWACDLAWLQQQIREKANDLFSSQVNDVKVWSVTHKSIQTEGLIVEHNIDSLDQLFPIEEGVASNGHKPHDLFYIIQQRHMQDRLLITQSTFTELFTRLNIFPYFLNTVLAFGLRPQDTDSTWTNFHCRHSGLQSPAGEDRVEICYTIRFFEQNQRKTGDPWSLRQTGVYQQHHSPSGPSVWVLIKPSARLKLRLHEKLEAFSEFAQLQGVHHLSLHILILACALSGWTEYIKTQRAAVEEFENKSFFSEADRVSPYDYKLGFEDYQDLQRLNRKLIKAASVLDATHGLTRRINGWLARMRSNGLDISPIEPLVTELDDLASEVTYYERCILDLQQRSSNAASLLLNLVEHRTGNSSLRSALANEASQKANSDSLEEMKGLSVKADRENSINHGVSMNIRALTFVATLYLPASLLSAIYSTPLIHLESGSLSVSGQFWTFFVILVPMAAVTFGLVLGLQVIWTKRYRKKRLALGLGEAES